MNTDPTDEERDYIVAIEAETHVCAECGTDTTFGGTKYVCIDCDEAGGVRSIEDSEQEKYDHDEHFGRKP